MIEDNTIYRQVFGNRNDDFAVNHEFRRMSQTGMFICVKGTARISLDENMYNLSANDIVVYFPYSTLRIHERSEDLYGIIMALDIENVQPLVAKITDVDAILNIRQHPVTKLKPEHMASINEYIQLYQKHLALSKEYAQNNLRRYWQLNNLQLDNVKTNLILQIITAYSFDNNYTKNVVDRKDEIVRKFLTDLHKHYVEQHEVGFYADLQYISMRYFSSVVKERTSRTPSQWITTVLVKDAKELLTDSNLTVKEIADRLHFPNQSYFGKWFKTHVGMGPLEYKKIESSI